MKLWSTYVKEMKIAARGYYFYIEIAVAVIMLIILLVAVEENPDGNSKEFLYNDIPSNVLESLYTKEVTAGNIRFIEDTEFVIAPSEFVVLNKDTGIEETFKSTQAKTVTALTYQKLDQETGNVIGLAYVLDSEEDMIRLSYNESVMGAKSTMDADGTMSYKYYLQGFETERFEDILYMLHTYDNEALAVAKKLQTIKEIGNSDRLNNREAIVPVIVGFSGALMGFFIIMSYVFLDKNQGVIKAYVVTPSSVWSYLLSKIFVQLTTVIISSSIVVIPIMKFKPNYLLFYVFLIAAAFLFACLGLLIASFFDSISKAFGVLYLIMIGLMLPAFSYFIGSFDPLWIRFLPTYPLLEGFKGIMKGNAELTYVLTYTAVFVLGGFILLGFANIRFKKTLTV